MSLSCNLEACYKIFTIRTPMAFIVSQTTRNSTEYVSALFIPPILVAFVWIYSRVCRHFLFFVFLFLPSAI